MYQLFMCSPMHTQPCAFAIKDHVYRLCTCINVNTMCLCTIKYSTEEKFCIICVSCDYCKAFMLVTSVSTINSISASAPL